MHPRHLPGTARFDAVAKARITQLGVAVLYPRCCQDNFHHNGRIPADSYRSTHTSPYVGVHVVGQLFL